MPFIDDHIHTSEPVMDYLTDFSGIHSGSLFSNLQPVEKMNEADSPLFLLFVQKSGMCKPMQFDDLDWHKNTSQQRNRQESEQGRKKTIAPNVDARKLCRCR